MFYPYALASCEHFLEVVDANDTPLLLQPRTHVLEQGLAHRNIFVLIQDKTKRLLLVRDTTTEEKQWHILHTAVYAGEAREHAAIRIFQEHLSFPVPEIMHTMRIDEENLHNSLFIIMPIPTAYTALGGDGILWVDYDELTGLSNHFSEMFTPQFLHFMQAGIMYRLLHSRL